MPKKIAVIACFGELPILAAKNLKENGYDPYIVKVMSYCNNAYEEYKNISLKIGEVGRLFDYLNKNNIEKIVFAGKVERPDFKAIKFDLVGGKLLYRILKNKVLGDDKVLRTVIDFFEENNFRIIELSEFMTQDKKETMLTNRKPNEREIQDIKFGMNLIEKISEFDVGQGVIIEDGYILGIEAAEGTDELIKRCGSLKKNKTKSGEKTTQNGVLVKSIKQNQSLKADLPVIGIETIKNLYANNFAGIGISKDVIIINEALVQNVADELDIFIYVV